MSFAVRIPERIQGLIASWLLSTEVRQQIYRHFVNDLAPNGLQRLGRVHVPFNGYLYRFAVREAVAPSILYVFDFRVEISRDETELIVAEGWYTCTVGPDEE